MLSEYRILDLTDDRGLIGGMILADLGADVIAIEPPGGNVAANADPSPTAPTTETSKTRSSGSPTPGASAPSSSTSSRKTAEPVSANWPAVPTP